MILVQHPGMYTTIQDLGRPGYESQGVPRGGAADRFAFRTGNLLVGNEESAASLESTLSGPILKFKQHAVVAITGAQVADLPMNRPWRIKAGQTVDLRQITAGCRAYLAIAGGIDVPEIMDSRSTYTRAKIGGMHGRPLIKGDTLTIRPGGKQLLNEHWGIYSPASTGTTVLRAIKGPQWNWFSESTQQQFFKVTFRVGVQSDRMGLRLEGTPIHTIQPRELISEATALGTVQVPPGGNPILLMPDRPTLGGYPKIAAVIATDMNRAAQARPGDELRFAQVTLEEAQKLRSETERQLQWFRMGTKIKHEGI